MWNRKSSVKAVLAFLASDDESMGGGGRDNRKRAELIPFCGYKSQHQMANLTPSEITGLREDMIHLVLCVPLGQLPFSGVEDLHGFIAGSSKEAWSLISCSLVYSNWCFQLYKVPSHCALVHTASGIGVSLQRSAFKQLSLHVCLSVFLKMSECSQHILTFWLFLSACPHDTVFIREEYPVQVRSGDSLMEHFYRGIKKLSRSQPAHTGVCVRMCCGIDFLTTLSEYHIL